MDFYSKAVSGLPEGHSSYFESPHRSLDPNLFQDDRLREAVRNALLAMLVNGLQSVLSLHGMHQWLHAWLAGSGITYQWEGGEGDLDVLFGVDMTAFYMANSQYEGLPESHVADWVNDLLRKVVWPETSNMKFGGRTYEVTFFWNPGTDDDIRNIKPYAAYDLIKDRWTVPPPILPQDPASLYPAEWYEAARRDTNSAAGILGLVKGFRSALDRYGPDSPQGRTAAAGLARATKEARALFDEIHHGRRAAFGPQGKGYGDWANFRWQHAKQEGAVPALRDILEQAKEADEAKETELYGGPIDGPAKILMRDMLRPRAQ